MRIPALVSFAAIFTLWSGAAQAASPPPASVAPQRPGLNAYGLLTAEMKRMSGLFDVLTKNDQIYFDLAPSQLGRTYVIEPVIAKGIGGDAFAGRSFEAFAVKFVREGNRLLWVTPNDNFIAPRSASAKLSAAESISDSVIGSSPILAEDAATKRIVIAPTLLAGDFEGIAALLSRSRGPAGVPGLLQLAGPSFSFDAANSYFGAVKAFPNNVELLVNLAFAGPATPSVADGRNFQIAMHYSIVAPPEASTYVPRNADDRVGYFVETLKRLGDGDGGSPFVRYIMRWNVRDGPIVFYLTDEIPPQYRNPIRRGILAWNAAFERVGLHRAIEVRDRPEDPAWNPDDARYSTIRWISSDTPSFGAYTGVFNDPRTGEIFRSEIVIDGEYIRTVREAYVDQAAPLASATFESNCTGTECAFTSGFAAQAAFARTAASIMGHPVDRNAYVADWLQSVVMHEVGHSLGLRHNFAASTAYSLAQIHDAAFTRTRGLSASVMDYLPANISPPHVKQGAYFQDILGPYDYWAIKYGYAPHVDLGAVARESSRPEYAFGTDDDSASPSALDPRISAFDLSSDPLAYDAEQFALSRSIVNTLDRRFPSNDDRYYDERLAFLSVMQNYVRAATLAVRYIGGEYTSRTHRGQPGGRAPFTPVSRATARRAFDLLAENVFAPNAFTFSQRLVRDLGPDYFHGWGSTFAARPDFPVLAYTGSVQDAVLNSLFHPVVLGRVYDVEAESAGNGTLRLQDVFEWTRGAAFGDVENGRAGRASAAHRELQRHFVDLLVAYQSAPSALVQTAGAPREAQALARYELKEIDAEVTRALRWQSLDVTTRAHLEDVQTRTERALHGINVIAP